MLRMELQVRKERTRIELMARGFCRLGLCYTLSSHT